LGDVGLWHQLNGFTNNADITSLLSCCSAMDVFFDSYTLVPVFQLSGVMSVLFYMHRSNSDAGSFGTKYIYCITYGAEPFLRSCQLCSPQEPPSILWNPKVQYRVHKSPPLVPILSHINPVHSIPSYLSKILLILSTHLRLCLPSGLFPSGMPTNILYAFLFSPIRATCPAHLILHILHYIVIIHISYMWSDG
jgi:hypothetical protein